MTLIARYTTLLVALLLVVLGGLTLSRVARQRAAAIEEVRRRHEVLGGMMRARAIDIAQSPRATERMRHAMEVANRVAGGPRFEWLEPPEAGDALGDKHVLQSEILVSVFPVRVDDRIIGAVRIRESLAPENQRRQAELVATLTRVGLLTLLCILLSLAVGRWMVAVPMRVLIEKAERTGRGDFSAPLRLSRRDELGALAHAIDAMCDALAEERSKVLDETRRRIAANDELLHAERMATAGRLAAGIAHELGTPLAVLAGRAQMISGGEVAGEAARKSAEIIERQADRIRRIISQLLDFVRRRGSKGGTCDVAQVVERVTSLLRPTASARGLAVRVTVGGRDCMVSSDPESLGQVVTNVMANGLDAMSPGGELVVATSVERIAPRRDPSGQAREFVRIDVTDTGPGIPAEVVGRVFEPFFTTRPPAERTGLGLSVAHGIVEDLGGWITVETGPKGSQFSIFVPRVEHDQASDPGGR
jgi:two-component system NtrC family sensor kinase